MPRHVIGCHAVPLNYIVIQRCQSILHVTYQSYDNATIMIPFFRIPCEYQA